MFSKKYHEWRTAHTPIHNCLNCLCSDVLCNYAVTDVYVTWHTYLKPNIVLDINQWWCSWLCERERESTVSVAYFLWDYMIRIFSDKVSQVLAGTILWHSSSNDTIKFSEEKKEGVVTRVWITSVFFCIDMYQGGELE